MSDSELLRSEQEQIAASGRNVYVVWSEDNEKIWFARSLDRGVSFAPAEKLSTTPGAEFPHIATYRDNVYVVWEAPFQGEIYFAESDDEGDTFDVEENISNTAGFMSTDPEIAVSGNRVIVTWRDEDTPAGEGIEIFYRQGK